MKLIDKIKREYKSIINKQDDIKDTMNKIINYEHQPISFKIPIKRIEYGEIYKINLHWYLYSTKGGEMLIGYPDNTYLQILNTIAKDNWRLIQFTDNNNTKAIIRRIVWE